MKTRYRLLKAHKINQVLHPAGTEIDLTPQLGGWFVDQAIAEVAAAPATASEVRAPAPERTAPVYAPPIAQTPRFGSCCGWKT